MAPQDSKIAVEILQSVNNRTQNLREILRMVIIDTVIKTVFGRLTLDPAGMHCSWWDDAFVSSSPLHAIVSQMGSLCPWLRYAYRLISHATVLAEFVLNTRAIKRMLSHLDMGVTPVLKIRLTWDFSDSRFHSMRKNNFQLPWKFSDSLFRLEWL